jgi:hypothetical protein
MPSLEPPLMPETPLPQTDFNAADSWTLDALPEAEPESLQEHPDNDFYAVSFTLNELGELVPDDHGPPDATTEVYSPDPLSLLVDDLPSQTPSMPTMQAAIHAASTETVLNSPLDTATEMSPPLPVVPPVPEAVSPPPMPAQPATIREEILPPPLTPPETAPLPNPVPTASTAGPTFAATSAAASLPPVETPPAEPPQPRRIQPKPLMQRTPTASPEPKPDKLEAQWESQPDIAPPPAPAQPSALTLGNLDIAAMCPLTAEKRLIIIQNGEIYALMGQVGLEQPQISVLKVFDHNPIAYQNTFTAVEEGQAGHQGMYVVQVGTWHGIISTFQDKITLHTELG